MKKIVMMMFAAMFTMNMLAENVKIKVTNMHCENCAKRVEKTLKTNEAVSQVKVDLECQTICVSYDAEKTNVEALTKALIDAKFEVEIVKQCAKEGGYKHDGNGKSKEEKHECGSEGCGKHQEKTQE